MCFWVKYPSFRNYSTIFNVKTNVILKESKGDMKQAWLCQHILTLLNSWHSTTAHWEIGCIATCLMISFKHFVFKRMFHFRSGCLGARFLKRSQDWAPGSLSWLTTVPLETPLCGLSPWHQKILGFITVMFEKGHTSIWFLLMSQF